MYKNYSISTIIPCYNEGKSLPCLLREVPDFVDEVIVVDNNSTDNTSEVAKECHARVLFEKEKGYGRAHKTGLEHATKDIIFAIDGDGAFHPQSISKFLDVLIDEELDFVWGNRFLSENKIKMKTVNFIGNKILTCALNWIYAQNICDSQSGIWLFRRNLLSDLDLTSDGMAFSEEIKVEVLTKKYIKYREVPVVCNVNICKRNVFFLFWEGIKNLIFLFKKRIR